MEDFSRAQQSRLDSLKARELKLLEKLARQEKQGDLETRVEEDMRLDEGIAQTKRRLDEIKAEMQTLEISSLIQEANRLKSNQNYTQAIHSWHKVKQLQDKHPLAEAALAELYHAEQAFKQAQKPIRQLARHSQALAPIWSELLHRLRYEHLRVDFQTLVDVTNDYCDGKMDAQAFMAWYQSAIQGTVEKQRSVDELIDVARRIKQGDMVLFLGSDIAKHYHDDCLNEQEIAQQLAQQADYGDFKGSLTSIAEYYQSQVGMGTTTLLQRLQRHLPNHQHQSSIRLYCHLAQTQVPQILITTVYDNLLEETFLAANKPFVRLSAFIYDGDHYQLGNVHVHYSDQAHKDTIMMADELSKMEFTRQGYSVIYKMRGSCCDHDKAFERDALILAERQFFDFARFAHRIIPNNLSHEIRKRGFLFLGYRPRNWHDRLLVKTLLAKRQNADESCYVLSTSAEPLEEAHWKQHHVERYPFDLSDLDACFTGSVADE